MVRRAKQIGEILSYGTFANPQLRKKVKSYEGLVNWPHIIGEHFAEYAKPERIIRGTILLIKTKNAAIASEIMLERDEILERYNQSNTGAYISDIRAITVSPREF